jgi:signal transduction histidine kinase
VSAPIRILHLEDAPSDAELVEATLVSGGLSCRITHVDNARAFCAALDEGPFDVVLADNSLPGFNGRAALQEVGARRPGTPFVFVSGSIGEEFAVDLLKEGGTDYVLKDRLSRLCTAVTRAIREAEEKRLRLKAEEALKETHQLVARIVEATPNVLYVYELDGGAVLYAGGQVERVLGRTAEALRAVGVGPSGLGLLEAQIEERRRRLAEAKDGEPVELGWDLRRPDGVLRSVHTREVVFARGADGSVTQVLAVLTDVTERKSIEAQFLRAQRMESIGTLAGGIAHDLNNVLSPILMAVDILRRRMPDERSQKLLATLEASARRGGEMVKQILTFARGIQGDRVVLQSRHLLREVAKLIQKTFPKTIEIRTDLASDLWTVSGDATQLHQVLLNLCVNARDAMPHGGRLTLAGANAELDAHFAALHLDARPGPYVVLTVSDTGTGIPSAILERIFEPFFTTKDVGQGTGLGLSTSLAIVKSHGGFINAYSEIGRGTVFRVYLPAASGKEREARAEGAELPTGQGELILVVEDEEAIRELARAALESGGYRVATAADGSEAVAFYARSGAEVAAVITDMRMPVMDGPATIKALRKLNPRVKVLASSGLGEEGGGAGDELLRKPYTTRELLTAVKRLLTGAPTTAG